MLTREDGIRILQDSLTNPGRYNKRAKYRTGVAGVKKVSTRKAEAIQNWKAENPNAPDLSREVRIGDGIFTVTSGRDGSHRTFRVDTVNPKGEAEGDFAKRFAGRQTLALLAGPDNTSDYRGIGFITPEGAFIPYAKQKGTVNEKLGRVFQALMTDTPGGLDLKANGYRVQASLNCRRCGRTLSVPSSLNAQLGPDCQGYYM